MASITIDDVAALAEVSIKTVSRVLNHEPHVRVATRERVLAAVETLGYRPNASARALAGSRSYLLALFLDNASPAYHSQLEQGAMSACRDAGYHLVVEQFLARGEELARRLTAFHNAIRMDGVILPPPLCDQPEVLASLEAEKTPYVRIAPTTDLDRAPYVFMDDRAAAHQMTVYLRGLGHRDIAFITGPADHYAAARRLEGFQEAMSQAGLSVRPEWIQRGDFSFRSGSDCAERLLAGPDRPTAVFAGNDDMALGVMAVANRLHIDLPGQMTLAGFDDSPSAQVVWPQLTTVRQPTAEMARIAVERLVGAGRDDEAPKGRQLDFELMIRQSSGPAPTDG